MPVSVRPVDVAGAAREESAAVSKSMPPLLSIPGVIDRQMVHVGNTVIREGDAGDEMFFVLEGTAIVERGGVEVGRIGPGDHFGELALFSGAPRAATVRAESDLALGKLGRAAFERLLRESPDAAIPFVRALVRLLGRELTAMTDSVSVLLRERSLPRRTELDVTVSGEHRSVHTGTSARALLPTQVDGHPVVAALLENRAVSLHTPISSDAHLAPLTSAHWEGRKIWRRSIGLLLLEAASRVCPDVPARLGGSTGNAQRIELHAPPGTALESLAAELTAEMIAITASGAPLSTELWTIEEASAFFADRGDRDVVALLATTREATVPLASCGSSYVLALDPVVPDASLLRGFEVVPSHGPNGNGGLVLRLGDESLAGAPGSRPFAAPPRERPMVNEHRRWLTAMGADSVGAFNELCISGRVGELIRIAEGFHEKSVGRIVDAIAARRDSVRVICVAGPSSSGKTTFLKRLTIQLRIEGIRPIGISLDDYYVDRDLTPKDEKGEFDYEALDALSLPLLQDHVRKLLRGDTVRTARYDFLTGSSHPADGPELSLSPGDVLLLEGIHGLNPALLGDAIDQKQRFGIFIEPATALRFDRLETLSVADLRLLRRIVRDRFTRGATAADNIRRWPSVRAGERRHIFPFEPLADAVYDSSLVYEPAVLKVFAERYLLEVPREHPSFVTAHRLRRLIDRFVAIYPEHVPTTSILREFIGGSSWER
jgi:uridine kinase